MKNFKTIREVASLWRKEKQLYVKQSTLFAHVLIIENHIVPALGNKRALTEEDVQEFVLQNGLSQKTVKGILVVLKMIQKFGSKHNFLPISEWSVKYPTEQRKEELDVLSIDNQRKIMENT